MLVLDKILREKFAVGFRLDCESGTGDACLTVSFSVIRPKFKSAIYSADSKADGLFV